MKKIEVNTTRMTREREHISTYKGYVLKIELNTLRMASGREYTHS